MAENASKTPVTYKAVAPRRKTTPVRVLAGVAGPATSAAAAGLLVVVSVSWARRDDWVAARRARQLLAVAGRSSDSVPAGAGGSPGAIDMAGARAAPLAMGTCAPCPFPCGAERRRCARRCHITVNTINRHIARATGGTIATASTAPDGLLCRKWHIVQGRG